MIRSKITVKGKAVAICHVERKNEMIGRLMENQVGRKKRKNKTYHAYHSRSKENNKHEEELKVLLMSMIISKQQFEAELLKARIRLNKLRKVLGN